MTGGADSGSPGAEAYETRDERLAKNEAFFREANEIISREQTGWSEREFICECSARGCLARVALTKGEYEHMRANARRFIVVPGHERLEVETVVETHDDYLIVEKTGEAGAVAVVTDPR